MQIRIIVENQVYIEYIYCPLSHRYVFRTLLYNIVPGRYSRFLVIKSNSSTNCIRTTVKYRLAIFDSDIKDQSICDIKNVNYNQNI